MAPDVVRFSTDALPDGDRFPIWMEMFGRSIVKADLEHLDDSDFKSEFALQSLPDVAVGAWSGSALGLSRTPSLVADGDDDLLFIIVRQGRVIGAQGDREVELNPGDAYLWSNASTGMSRNPVPWDLVTLTFPRRSLAASVADLDDATMRLMPARSEALQLLISYVDILQQRPDGLPSELKAASASHIHDLAAMALGATRDAAQIARNGGVRAARLAAIRKDVLANLTSPDLSAETLAPRHGISARYIRSLFEGERTSFTDFVREQRLRRARLLLSDPAKAHLNVSTIAYACGFGDLSHFNHAFRKRFGATPSDIRHLALTGSGEMRH
jgi:AraC-like DNA-binding protein